MSVIFNAAKTGCVGVNNASFSDNYVNISWMIMTTFV